MEFPGASGKPWAPKLTLENYLHLEKLDVISSSILRKIIMMHGFKSVKVPKNDLMGAVRSIDLMDAHHSTLQSDVSSNAFLSLNDVIRDLSVLRWQECCITALETINCVTDFSSVVDEASSKCSKSECNTAFISRNDSVGHKTQSQELMKFTVKGIRSARPLKRNFNTASSWTGNPEGYTTQLQALDKIKEHTSAKHVKPNFNTVVSSKDDFEGHQAQSHALNKIAVKGKRSAEPYKPNFEKIYTPVFSSKNDFEGHQAQSHALNTFAATGKISAEPYKPNFDKIYTPVFCSKDDSEGHQAQSHALNTIATEKRSAEPYKPNFDKIYTPVFSSKVDSEGHKTQSLTLNETSKSSNSECNTASISRNDSVDHKTQSQVLMKFTVKGIRSARPFKRNFNTASSWTGNPEGYTPQLQALEQTNGHTSAKHVKPTFNTVFSSKDDSEGHKAQSHALNTFAVTEKRSAEPYKPNFDKIYTPVFSSKVDSEGHKTQSQTLNERNISPKYGKPNFNTVFSSQEDSEGHKAQSQALSIIASSGKTSAKPVKPNFNTAFSSKEDSKTLKTQSQALDLSADKENRLAPNFNTSFCSKDDSGGRRTQFQLLEKIDGNTSSARFGKEVYHRPRKGIKKPNWMKSM